MGDPNLTGEFSFLGFRLDVGKRCLFNPEGQPVSLSSRALDILTLLVQNRGTTLSKTYLVEHVWPDAVVEENNLNQAISSLRRALDDSKNNSRFIKTVTGRGYCFVAEIDEPLSSDTNLVTATAESSDESDLTEIHQSLPPLANTGHNTRNSIAFFALLLVMLAGGVMIYYNSADPAAELASTSTPNIQTTELAPTSAASTTLPNSIAVLPLTNLTLATDADADRTIFTLGLHDELIHQLGMTDNLTLVSQESFLAPDIREYSLGEIGRLLNVDSLLTGTILFQESKARIILQILQSQTGVIKWTYAYEINTGNFSDMLETQHVIARKIANVVHGGVNQALSAVPTRPTASYEAYRYNVAARSAFSNMNFSETLHLTKKSLAVDPDYVGAMYNFSKANSFLAIVPSEGMTTSAHQQLALDSAQRIIELAPELHDGYLLKAHSLASLGRWKEAMQEVHTLKDLDAPLFDNYLLAPLLMSLGDFQAAIDALEANLTVQPINAYGRGLLLTAYESSGNPVQAQHEYEIGEELNPIWWGDTVNTFLALGRHEKVQNIQDLYKTPHAIKSMLHDLNEGNYAKLHSILEVHQATKTNISSEYIFYAAIAAAIDAPEMAVDFMELNTADMSTNIFWFWLPLFHDARQLPQFRDLLKKLGLVSYWQEFGWPAICHPQDDSFICD